MLGYSSITTLTSLSVALNQNSGYPLTDNFGFFSYFPSLLVVGPRFWTTSYSIYLTLLPRD